MTGKHDSFGRSAGYIFGENGFPVPVSRVNVLYSFGRSREMTGNDTFGRSAGYIFGENGFPVPVSRVNVLYSFGRSREKPETTPSEGVQDRFSAKVG